MRISVLREGACLIAFEGQEECNALYRGAYQAGDVIRFEGEPGFYFIMVDQCVPLSRVYLPKGVYTYPVPLEGDGLNAYPPYAFQGDRHVLSMRPCKDWKGGNLALNPVDRRGASEAYPHVTANVETRGESNFAARNVIDGLHTADGHGSWPYGSWGIGTREDAEILLEFGRLVRAESMVLYLRADFPHDAWWTEGRVTLSDGAELSFPLEKKNGPQRVDLGNREITWIKLWGLKKADGDSPFPALRQWEVYGTETE